MKFLSNLETIFCIALPLSVLKQLFEKYLFSDWDFLYFLCIIVAIDTFFGVWKHYKLRTLSSKGFADFFTKIIVYFGFLVVCNIMVHYTISGQQNMYFGWFDDLAYSAIVVREAISIIENIGAINNNLLPPWILKRLRQFDSTGKYTVEK